MEITKTVILFKCRGFATCREILWFSVILVNN